MIIYVLAPDETEFGINRKVATVGFILKGEEVRLFRPEEIEHIPISKNDIVFGGIHFAHCAMERLGIPIPALESIPTELRAFAGRRSWRSTMGEVRMCVEKGEMIFIKPLPERHKLFGGQLLQSFRDLIPTAGIEDTEQVECAEPVEFISEYRSFVVRGELIGLRHYKGDPLVFPNSQVIRDVICAYRAAPAACAIDFGVTKGDKTIVVEVNDGYSTVAYGLSPRRYASVIEARWDELRQTAV
ncbi:ATP-grasp domain-containing protein [Roseibium sp. HPY-6]|uniref:ATP-grasp domain-containing protein n=1 Tax=Roseibium sp. HPY-6 TaxID=3229852 RepID=UPI00338E8D3F